MGKPFHEALDSAVATCLPSISRYPPTLTPVANWYRALDYPSAFAHFDRNRVARQVGVPAGIERADFEVCDHIVEFFRHT
ncbi:hypothetical protein [Corynebacterium striatum]|uniref:hypothetical protein n=1 Tax=Corynebacterium striatum TaxID=43770 RepID=UPI003B59415E